MRWYSDIQSGPEPFPQHNMALDISEFRHGIHNFDLFMSVENLSDATGTVNAFSVELYNDYGLQPFKVLSSSGVAAIPENDTALLSIDTTGVTENDLFQILSVPGYSRSGTVFYEEKPDAARLEKDKQIMGVYESGINYNVLYKNTYGTGYKPPTKEAWNRMVRLKSISFMSTSGELPYQVDHSQSRFFPPIGTQGLEGSCTAFSFAYYIHTYTEAREHGWDLSGAQWLHNDPSGGDNQGGPSESYAALIFSPDFVYHAINDGVDSGSNGSMAAALLARIGCATWAEMPYDTQDSTSWPSESAYREAAQFRAGEVVENPYHEHNTTGYFTIEDNTDIHLLKTLLAAGYCVQTVVYTDGLYDLFDANDVVSGYSDGPMTTNHAQTVVGYKEDNAWDESNPDG